MTGVAGKKPLKVRVTIDPYSRSSMSAFKKLLHNFYVITIKIELETDDPRKVYGYKGGYPIEVEVVGEKD